MPGLRQAAAARAAPTGARPRELIGIAGGMGPLASAELLRTIYRTWLWDAEQDGPRMLLWSDPVTVDRTTAIDRGDLNALRSAVEHSVSGLVAAGADRVVIACVTAHHVLDRLPAAIAGRCVSLIDIIHEELGRASEPHLLLCTRGTIQAGLFERMLAEFPGLVTLAGEDQDALHGEIYRLKRGHPPSQAVVFLRDLLARYRMSAFVAACTELHLVTRAMEDSGQGGEFAVIDPLTVVATRIREGTL